MHVQFRRTMPNKFGRQPYVGGFKFDVPSWLSGLGPWIAVVTTGSGSIMAHMAAQRYDELSVSYLQTANRLIHLRDLFKNDANKHDQHRILQFINAVESAISAENEEWRAGWVDNKIKVGS